MFGRLRETVPVRHWLEPTKKVADVTAMTVRPHGQQVRYPDAGDTLHRMPRVRDDWSLRRKRGTGQGDPVGGW